MSKSRLSKGPMSYKIQNNKYSYNSIYDHVLHSMVDGKNSIVIISVGSEVSR